MNNVVSNEKKKTRSKIIAIRKNIPLNEVMTWSKRVGERFFNLQEYRNAEVIMFYVSYDNEVYTHDMIKKTLSDGKRVVVPLSDTKRREVLPVEIQGFDELKAGTYGILEPFYHPKRVVSKDELDLVVVPGVAFDLEGHRIGHGFGYYDSFLRETRVRKIGFAFEFQIVPGLPEERWDVKVDKIVTEKRVIECR
ncbi:MAG TPA: 5-formyltetrahydrofolate cyclo-ligase [Thermoplasmata archaeon]|nr:5-formyltetrahydrofolate cyclo-ligase [Thermoplasmata archaeon]